MKLLFWLYKSRVNKAGQCPIMMRITIANQRASFSTNIFVEENVWDSAKLKVKGNSELATEQNNTLNTLRSKAWHEYNEFMHRGINPDPVAIRDRITGQTKPTVTLLEAISHHIKYLESRLNIGFAPNTLKKYQTLLKKTKCFLEHSGLSDINLFALKSKFIQDFDTYMRTVEKLSNNGVAKNMQQLKRVIKVCIQNEWIDKNPFPHYYCTIQDTERGYLTAIELEQLINHSFNNKKLDRVRDVFVFCCYTGLSYADLSKLSSSMFEKDSEGVVWIKINRAKTSTRSVIPLLPMARTILCKYTDLDAFTKLNLPVISNQNLNKYLKEVAAQCGINKRVSMHLARHTFATTVTLEKGVDISTVSRMLGHKNIKTTQIYSKVTELKIAADIQKLL